MSSNVWAGETTDQLGVGTGLWLGLDMDCVVINGFNNWEIKNCDGRLAKFPFICQRTRE